MTIKELYKSRKITFRAFNFCKLNGLLDLSSILKFFEDTETFKTLTNHENKIYDELIEFCHTSKKKPELNNLEKEESNKANIQIISLDELSLKEELSVRSYNVCRLNGLKDILSIIEYFFQNNKFIELRHCGAKSNDELTKLSLKYIETLELTNTNNEKVENEIAIKISNLTLEQRSIINDYIVINIEKLSERSKNALVNYLDNDLKIKNFGKKIFEKDVFDVFQIRHVGNKSAIELKNFFLCLSDFINSITLTESDQKLASFRNKFLIEKKFLTLTIPNEIIENSSIFRLTEFFLEKNVLLDKNENYVLKKGFKIYADSEILFLEKIALDLNISKERVRQIRSKCINSLTSHLEFYKNLETDLLRTYNIDLNDKIIVIDNQVNDNINYINNTNFSPAFTTYILFMHTSEKFSLLGNIEDVLLPKNFNSRYRHKWGNLYLVKQHITNLFDFYSFIDDIDKRLNDRIEETYWFHFKSYLSNFMKVEDITITPLVLSVAEKILNKEFDLIIDLNDNIVFKRNTVKHVSEFAIEALEKLGVPSNIDDIFLLIEKDYPQITKSKDALRGSFQRTPEIIYFGRSSTYGLKKWEIEKEGIKGGTIKDIILEYMEERDYPIHILELVNEVNKYREETNAKNILTNLKLDPQYQFIVFNQSFIGLSRKSYKSKLTNLPKFLGKSITNYIKQNRRVNRINVEEYFSNQLGISLGNTKYIIENLIEQDFIQIDNQNNLSI
jgi:hypothetical protein